MIRAATPLDIALMIALAAIYGSAFTAIKIAVPAIGPYGLVLARVVIGFCILAPYASLRGWQWPTEIKTWFLIGVLCIFNLVLPFLLISWAQFHLNASLTALLMGAGPFFGLLVSHFGTGDDRMTAGKLIGVAVGFVGIAVVLGADALAAPADNGFFWLAPAAALLSSLCYASSGLLVRKMEAIAPSQLATLVLGMGSLGLLIAMPLAMPEGPSAYLALDGQAMVALLYLSIVATGGAYVLRYTLLRSVGVSYLGLSLYFVPLFGITIAAFWLSEPLPPSLLLGLACIIAGLIFARRKPVQARA